MMLLATPIVKTQIAFGKHISYSPVDVRRIKNVCHLTERFISPITFTELLF